ncbi:MAG: MmgE/PrpD family protein [Ectothiorhodospiraceae bacterium]|nr:MmgE/PrpD family protein [Chromatiales bacterium]MCP5154532.1 MmgE/PrpD family protein [Ectothiorhodospiraceae bacterium]
MSGITRTLAAFAAQLDCATLPREVVERARLLILDQFGIAIRARNEAEPAAPAAAALARLGLTGGAASVIGDPAGYTPQGAAFMNGMLGHSLDFDDTHAPGSIHPSAPIVPAALAAAEMVGASGRDVIAAVVAGYEVQIRLSLALGPSDHYRRGYHPTATCGAFGAAAAAGRVLGLDVDQMVSAFGMCASQAAGSMQFLVDGSWNKPFHVGHAAMNGVTAATFAREGFFGCLEAIEGKAGFLNAYAPSPDPAKAVAGLGKVWETMAIAVKPYPSCRYGHAAMDALIALRAEHGFTDADVESVEIGLPQTGWNIIGNPESEKQSPENYVDGQFSMPFVAAVALRDGGMVWDSYAKHLRDPRTMALARRIRTVVDPKAEAEFPAHMAGVARVTLRDGTTHEGMVVAAKGEPENFLTAAEFRAKFDGLATPFLGSAGCDALARALSRLDTETDIAAVMALSRPTAAPLRAAVGGDD